MVHIPAAETYQEILKSPHLVRMSESKGLNGIGLSLLIRGSSFNIKYLLRSDKIKIVIFKLDSSILCYALVINDDEAAPLTYWSAVKDQSELSMFHSLLVDRRLMIHLFNEVCANVASAEAVVEINSDVIDIIRNSKYLRGDVDQFIEHAVAALERAYIQKTGGATLHLADKWQEINCSYISDDIERFDINIINGEEGSQQENLARWLADGLSPSVVHLSPEVHELSGNKEFTDLVISYEGGTFLFMSKTLALLARSKIHNREKLGRDILGDLRQDARKIKNQCKKIHSGEKIFANKSNNEIFLERKYAIHAICIVPDLSLIAEVPDFDRKFLSKFADDHGDMFHVMDTTQLFRTVQAAQMLSKNSSLSKMAAFDGYLIERFKFTAQHNKIDFDMTLSIKDGHPRIGFHYFPESL